MQDPSKFIMIILAHNKHIANKAFIWLNDMNFNPEIHTTFGIQSKYVSKALR